MRFDIVPILRELKIEPQDSKDDEVYAWCPHHDDTGKPNWSINLTTGQHHCWSCGYGGSLMFLIADRLGMYWPGTEDPNVLEARVWARRFRTQDLTGIKELVKTTKTVTSKTTKTEKRVIREPDLALFVDPPAWALEKRNLTLDAALKHGVRWDAKQNAWITPIRDPWSHHLIGWQIKSQVDRMFRNYPVGVEKHRTLFGLRAFDGGCAVLVESPLDVLRLESAGVTGGLATYGAAVSTEQISALVAYCESVVIAMDNPHTDKAGRAAAVHLGKALKRVHVRYFDYGGTTHKDPGDMTDEQIRAGVAGARSLAHGHHAVLA